MCSQDDVHSWISVHHLRQLTNLERKRRVLKGLLHLSTPKGSQISAMFRATTVTILGCPCGKCALEICATCTHNVLPVLLQLLECFGLSPCDRLLTPARWSARAAVFYKEMRDAHLLTVWVCWLRRELPLRLAREIVHVEQDTWARFALANRPALGDTVWWFGLQWKSVLF